MPKDLDTDIRVKYYSRLEEKINVISHAVGLVMAPIALVFLLVKAVKYGDIWHVVSFGIYGVSMVLLYAASTFYHLSKKPAIRKNMKVFDHAAIYLLIAGTYTPFTLVTLKGTVGWVLFGVSWGLASLGITLKLFFTGRFNLISTLAYVVMGWLIVFAAEPLLHSLSANGLFWLIIGGIFYTLGAILYAIDKLKFNHAIFHIFVLLGSISHFISIYFYVLQV
ncbi:FIG01964566: Predicted membrane protein, hemolysin III homolog [hydrothermal vent metagenome]|uniref:FIG01964566: Predicted membrane protein, hemolysin III homolog n=1 Tax=hydrothermal vent metagenome TaxID=652676 RepID=A0A3B0V2J0_9ZZZZ